MILEVIEMNMPGFTAKASLYNTSRHYGPPGTPNDLVGGRNRIIPAVAMGYCKYVCRWRVCGSAPPDYPVPMCYSCEQDCWMHDSGLSSRAF
jgi:hypothetical protein